MLQLEVKASVKAIARLDTRLFRFAVCHFLANMAESDVEPCNIRDNKCAICCKHFQTDNQRIKLSKRGFETLVEFTVFAR